MFYKDKFSFKKGHKGIHFAALSFIHSIPILFASRWEWICLSGVDNFSVIKSKCILNVEYETPMQLKLCVLELIKCSAWYLLGDPIWHLYKIQSFGCVLSKRKVVF